MHSSRMRTVRCSGRLSCHAPHSLWTEFLTHACENITFPQILLRTVTIQECHYLTNGRSAIKGRAQNIKPSTVFDISKFKTLKQNFKRSIFLSGHILQHYNSFTISQENWRGSTISVLTQACTKPETKLLSINPVLNNLSNRLSSTN